MKTLISHAAASKLPKVLLSAALAGIAPWVRAQADPTPHFGAISPGVYGPVDVSGGAPELEYPQPLVIAGDPYAWQRAPMYVYAPSEQQHQWRNYCERYSGCNRPVYFVREQWVQARYGQGGGGQGGYGQARNGQASYGTVRPWFQGAGLPDRSGGGGGRVQQQQIQVRPWFEGAGLPDHGSVGNRGGAGARR